MKTTMLSTTLLLLLLAGCGSGTTKGDTITSPATNKSSTSKVNKAPVATFDKFSINRDLRYNGQLNATDEDGDEIKYTIVKQPSHGSVILHNNGCFTYTPDAGYKGEDTFSYRASDDVSSCAVKTVTIDVCEKPVSKPAKPSGLKLEALSTSKIKISWDDNSNNEDGFEVYLNGNLARVINANSTTTMICGLEAGTSYEVKVVAKNATGISDALIGAITTKDVTTAPKAPTMLSVVSKDKTTIRLSWKDNANNESSYEIYQDGIKVKSVSSGCHCALICNLTPCKEYSFEVRAKNKIGESTGDNIDVMTEGCIIPENHAPTANEVNAITQNIDPVSITLVGTDPDGDALSYTLLTSPTLGTLSGSAPNLTYTPFTHASITNGGYDSFTYKVNDGSLDSNIATVNITVNDVPEINHAPVATPQNITLDEDTIKIITLSGTDADGDSLTYIVVTPPNHGTFDGTTYTPNPNYYGDDSFTFKANDGTIDSTPATVTITINSINDAPTVDLGGDVTITEGESITVNSHAADIDGTVVDHTWISNQLGDDPENSSTVTFTTLTVGKHEIKVFVTDDDGLNSNTDSMIITVLPAPTPSKLLKTGQISSYDENGTFLDTVDAETLGIKDDGYYQAGVSRSFTRNNTNNTVIDNVTGFVWQDDDEVGVETRQFDEVSDNYCHGKTLAGASATAPRIEDLFYLRNHETGYYDENASGDTYFQNGSPAREYWSDTSDHEYNDYGWVMKFIADLDGWAEKTEGRYIRCVSQVGHPYIGNFTRDDTKEVVTDSDSNLMWQDNDVVGQLNKISWRAAINYCETLDFAGFDDWRLPNINELYSIGDKTRHNPAIRTSFVNIVSRDTSEDDYYWSSTTDADQSFLAQAVEFRWSNTARLDKGNSNMSQQFAYVRCVRTK
jgi:hypothetical protein